MTEKSLETNDAPSRGRVLVLRPNSGVSGDILVSGLFKLLGAEDSDMDGALESLGFSELKGKVRVVERSHDSISGWGLEIDSPGEGRLHRGLKEITEIFEKSALADAARETALRAFRILAAAESRVHGVPEDRVSFHEVGALDSILDAGLASVFFTRLRAASFVCGPLPVCDGVIRCAHGLLNSPAPAVSILLEGMAVRGVDSRGETVTPTGAALLKAFGARFGPWPEMTVERQALIFGTRPLPGVPNGAQFALGTLSNPGDS
ncbi:MAG: LarC family nickel insertion protein [Deltaproteobacteria bacterium]|jgi:uncharacterized protein (DUF111 family)|nr:LarC family nickel insertion protein [Deltaproteobacteria bacterium]